MYDFVTNWGPLWGTLASVGQILGFMVVLLLSLAFLLLMDRKVWAAVQMRKGPNTVGAFGLLQSFADFLKFVLKEIIVPAGADRPLFLLAPLLTFIFAFITWAVIPVAPGWVISDLNVGVLYIFAISSLGVYGIIIGGWASNSKYPFLGSLRSAAQMVSYEVSIGFVLVTILLMAGTMNLSTLVEAQGGGFWNWHVLSFDMLPWPVFLITIPMFVVFFISALAETNRPPFDLPEAESELVAGYQVEYSSTPYLLFMIGEYLNIVLMCALMTVLFFGGWHAPFDVAPFTWIPPVFWFAIKVVILFFMFAMVKALVPRYRYDQLMRLGWKIFLPTSLAAVFVMGAVVVYTRNAALGG
jgi:NADH-quinone oxidoreductase subunit H